MQFLIKTLSLTLITIGLTACGGDGNGKKASSSSSPANSPIPSSSSEASVASSLASSSSQAAVSSSLASSVAVPVEGTGFSVAEIKDCGVNIGAPTEEEVYSIFADYDQSTQNQTLLNFSGWNHSTNENAARPEWAKLKQLPATYNFDSKATANLTCNGVDTLDIVLLKKVADWDFQHSNGFEKTILSDGKKFGDVVNIVVDLRINSEKTSIPTVAYLKSIYSPTYVNESKVDALDSGKVNIGFVIYDGKGSTVLSASRTLELDHATQIDKWIRFTIPMNDLKFCSTTQYECTGKTLADLSGTVIAGIQFVAETKNNGVLRPNISSWSSDVPETFKEVDVNFKKIEFQLK